MESLKVALYARVSDPGYDSNEAERKKRQDTDNQLFPLRDFVTNRGWVIYKEYVEDVSTLKKRPNFDAMMKDAYAGKFQAIVTVKIDRFARSVIDFVNFLQLLRGYNIRFIAITQNIDTQESNAASKLLVHMLIAIAEFERDIISERVKAGLAKRVREGKSIGRKVIVVDAAKAIESLDNGTATIESLCVEHKIKKSALYRKLKAYRVTAMQ